MHNTYTVTQVNTYIKNMFSQDFLLRSIAVEGEISNCKYHSSGHIYFTLKDNGGTIACVMFRSSAASLSFVLKEGQKVAVQGTVDVYERDGRYQLYAKKITASGDGELYEKYELLKKKLEEQGMFASEYKQPIPKFIKTLGVVTAPTGAAVRDIINITSRRNPFVQIILYPAIVQGDEAPASIVRGISALTDAGVDVIIVGRGGGSIEDLWAFNDESVAQAIFDCPIPIISAVGHETDTTIADYVADLRAPTPSAGAELAVYEYARFCQDLEDYRSLLDSKIVKKMDRYQDKISNYSDKLRILSPIRKVQDKQLRLDVLSDRLTKAMDDKILSRRHLMNLYIERLKGLSPLDKLRSGFSYLEDQDGNNIRAVGQVKAGQKIKTVVTDGVIYSTVDEVKEQYGENI